MGFQLNRWLVLACFGVIGCVSEPPHTSTNTFLVRSIGERQGEVEPCGCPRIPRGGLERLLRFGEKERVSNSIYVDTGNSFFSLPVLPDSRWEQETLKADLIAESYRELGVAALTPGARDLTMGIERLRQLAKKAQVSLVVSNLVDSGGRPAFLTRKIIAVGTGRLGITGYSNYAGGQGLQSVPPEPVLRKEIALLKKEGAERTIVLASDGGESLDARNLGADLIVGPPEVGGKSLIEYSLGPTRDIRFVDFDSAWDGPPLAFSQKVVGYLESVRSRSVQRGSREAAAVAKKTPGAFVAQAGTCRSCHEKQYDFWAKTKHASAYLVLFSKNQHFDPECIGCHSVGYEDPKGFSDITAPIVLKNQPARKAGEIPFVEVFMKEVFAGDPGGPLDSRLEPKRYAHLKNRYHEKINAWHAEGKLQSLHMGVQCEHCHGNRNGHPSPSFRKAGAVKPAACLSCHVPPHDDHFNFASKRDLVACPKR